MKKIPTIFVRDFGGNPQLVLDEINPECQWVFDGEGWGTRKLDGTCCMIRGGVYYKRREVKRNKADPPDFLLEDEDAVTGKRVGWVRVVSGDKWHNVAWEPGLRDGTYELVGPKVQGNPEHYSEHRLVAHDSVPLVFGEGVDRTYAKLREFLADKDIEGIVFHHPDGRMAKIKKKDFGLPRAPTGDLSE